MRGAADRNFEEIQKAVDKRKTVCYNLKVVADKRQPSEWKKVEKLLDKRSRVWYNEKLLSTATDRKKRQKLSKKVLDKRNEVMYNSNVQPETACTL